MKFDVIRTVDEQETVELLDILPRFAVSPLKKIREHTISQTLQKDVSLAYRYDEGLSYKFRELARNEHSAAPSVFPTTTRRIQNRTQVNYSRRGD